MLHRFNILFKTVYFLSRCNDDNTQINIHFRNELENEKNQFL